MARSGLSDLLSRFNGSVGLRCAPTYGYTDATFQADVCNGGGIMDEHTGTGEIFPTLFFDDGNGLKKTSDFDAPNIGLRLNKVRLRFNKVRCLNLAFQTIDFQTAFSGWQGPVFQTDFPGSTGSVGLRCAPTYGYTDAAFQAGGALGGG